MNKTTKKFISQFENKNNEDKQIIEKEILNYLTNYKNAELFKEIKKFVIEEVNDIITNIDDFDILNEIIKKYGKDEIISIIKNETCDFDLSFIALLLNYSYKIELRVKFNNFTYSYFDNGDIAEFGGNKNHYFIFDDDINDDIKKIFEIFFSDDIVGEHSYKWLYKYKSLYDTKN